MANETTFVEALGMMEEIGLTDVLVPFLLVFAVIYGVLAKIKILGEKKGWNAVIAFITALIMVVNPWTRKMLVYLLPSWTVLFLILIFIVIVFLFFGAKEVPLKHPVVYLLIIGMLILITVSVISEVFGPKLAAIQLPVSNITGKPDWTLLQPNEVVTIIFRTPEVLGLIVLMAIFIVATYVIVSKSG